MIKLKIKYFLLGGLILWPVTWFLFAGLSSLFQKTDLTYTALEKAASEIHCPEPAQLQYEAWGESGRMASCKIQHGPFVAAEHGHVVIRSEYSMGRLIGETKVFDAAGKVEKIEKHSVK